MRIVSSSLNFLRSREDGLELRWREVRESVRNLKVEISRNSISAWCIWLPAQPAGLC